MFTQPASTASAKRSPRARSRVQTAVRSPYGDALAICSASSSLEMRRDRDDRAERLLPRDLHLAGHAVEHRRLASRDRVGNPGARGRRPRARRRARARRRRDVHLRRRRLVVERAHRRLLRERIAEADRALDRRRGAARRTRRGRPRGRGTARRPCSSARRTGTRRRCSPRPPPRRPRPRARPAGRSRRARAAVALPAARAATCSPVATEPMKPTPCDPRAGGDLVADHGAGAGDHVEDAGRKLGVDDALRELHRADRWSRAPASRRRRCPRRAPARSAPPASCTASSTA